MNTVPFIHPGSVNPIIGDTQTDTLHQVACCLSFLGRVHADLADWACLAEVSALSGPDEMGWKQHRGLALLVECVRAACLHEMERGGA